MGILETLNEQQKKAVMEKHLRVCVIAGPGCGKTRTLISRAVYLLVNQKIPPTQILILTFAKKAIKEIKKRIALQIDSTDKSELNIYNFHSFCYRVLLKHAHFLGFPENKFPIYDRSDQESIIRKIIYELDYNCDQKEINTILSFIARCKNGWDVDPLYLTEFDQKRHEIYQKYQKYLKENKAMDFQDLLLYTIQLLNNQPQIQKEYHEQFQHILVDEFQDVNNIQWMILQQLTSQNQNLFLVGDPNQAIYGFQGATPELISSLTKKPEWTIIYLNINYRSTNNIIALANSFVEKNNASLVNNPLISTRENGTKIKQIFQFSLSLIIRRLTWLMINEKLQFNDIAILYRNNYLSMRWEQELTRQKIPYEILGAFKFIQREEIKDAIAFLRAIIYQDNLSLLRVLKINEGIGARTIEKIEENSEQQGISVYNYLNNYHTLLVNSEEKISSKQREKILEFILKINNFKEILTEKKTLHNFILTILNSFNYWEHLKSKTNAFEREKNLQQLLIIAENWERKRKKEFADVGELLEAFLEYLVIAFEDRKLTKTRNNLILSSIHQAKGLEFEIVLLAYCDNNILPYKETTDLTEERRLFYVAITRAKKYLFLLTNDKPSSFLAEVEKNYLEVENKKI